MDSHPPHSNPIPRPGGKLIREEAEKIFELDLETILRYSGLSLEEINPLLYDVFTDKQFV